jgi:hypothetical protein
MKPPCPRCRNDMWQGFYGHPKRTVRGCNHCGYREEWDIELPMWTDVVDEPEPDAPLDAIPMVEQLPTLEEFMKGKA